MLEHSHVGRRISTRSVDEVLEQAHLSLMYSQAILARVTEGDLHQAQATSYSREVIRQCHEACRQAKGTA